MSDAQGNNTVAENKIVVIDSRRVLMIGCVVLFFLFISGMCIIRDGEFLGGLACLALSVVVGMSFRVHMKGYIIDLDERTLEFPGGAVEANDISGMFDITKYYSRKVVALDGISQISTQWISNFEMKKTIFGDMMPFLQVLLYPRHHMLAHGAFGTLRFRFFSEGKRDTLYAMVAQVNEMGSPIITR